MKLADALVQGFLTLGVRHVFGVSGANIEHLHDAIFRLSSDKLQSVLAKTETGAAFMADAQARVHGVLGVCCATSGGGMMNLAVGIAESFQASVPVLAIVGQTPTSLDGRGAFQESTGIGRTVDALGLWRAMSKFAARIDDETQFWAVFRDALAEALGGRPGPSVLLIPRDLFDREVGEMPEWFPRSVDELRATVAVDALGYHGLVAALRKAKNPALVVGPAAASNGAITNLRRFAEATQIPVFTTMEAVSSFPQEHRLFSGIVGAAGHPSAHAFLNTQADTIVVVGSDLGAMVRGAIAPGLERAKTILVHPEPSEVARALPARLVVRGDSEAVFKKLLETHRGEHFSWRATVPELTRFAPTLIEGEPDTAGLLQSEAIAVLDQYLPDGAHVVVDAGNCAAAALHGMTLSRVSSATIALGMGGMGYSLAAAVGAQLLAAPGERTVVICGDGAFLMLGLEVHTAVDLGLPILFVVFNNAAHGMCVTRQNLLFEGRHEATRYDRVSIATTARGLGPANRLWVGRATTRGEMARLTAQYDAQGPMTGVLELVLEREEMPPFAPFLKADAPTVNVLPAAYAMPAE